MWLASGAGRASRTAMATQANVPRRAPPDGFSEIVQLASVKFTSASNGHLVAASGDASACSRKLWQVASVMQPVALSPVGEKSQMRESARKHNQRRSGVSKTAWRSSVPGKAKSLLGLSLSVVFHGTHGRSGVTLTIPGTLPDQNIQRTQ